MLGLTDKIEELLDTYSLEEIFEMNDLLPEEAIRVLYNRGLIKFPDYMDRELLEHEDYD